MLLVRRCPCTVAVTRRTVVIRHVERTLSNERNSVFEGGTGADQLAPSLKVLPWRAQQDHRHQPQQQQKQKRHRGQQHPQPPSPQEPQPEPRSHAQEPEELYWRREPTASTAASRGDGDKAANTTNTSRSSSRSKTRTEQAVNSNDSLSRHGLALLVSAVREVSLARRDLGWGVNAVAMRLTMLGLLRHSSRNKPSTGGGVPHEAISIDGDQDWLDGRAAEWERFLKWAHASYGWTEEVVVKRAGFAPGELEVVALSRGKSRNKPMAPTYVLAVDHARREIVLAVRGTKAFGDAITITHFRPEPFLDGYAHRGFAQSAHELVKQVEPQLTSLADRLPDYRIVFTGHSMGGGIAAMASMLIRDSANFRYEQRQGERWQQRRRQQQQQQQQPDVTASGLSSAAAAETAAAAEPTPPAPPPVPPLDAPAATGSSPRHPDSSVAGIDFGEKFGRDTGGREGAARAAAGTPPEGSGLGPRLGAESGPKVFSFATPCCVSLDLAQGCEGWVESVVNGDDAIPRLSTVSLELLKEDMTAAEWRRAVDRLAHLNTVLSPSTKAASAAAAVIKNALAGLGALRRSKGSPASTGTPDNSTGGGDAGERAQRTAAAGDRAGGERRREGRQVVPRDEAARGAVTAASTSALKAEEPRAEGRRAAAQTPAAAGTAAVAHAGAAAGRGAEAAARTAADAADKKETDRKRDDLGRSVRNTVLTMRGLAKLYPLSQSLRQEIASMVSQVVKLTGGEKGDGAGAITPRQGGAGSSAGRDGSGDRRGDDEGGHDQHTQISRSTGSGGSNKKRDSNDLDAPVEAAAAAATVDGNSKPDLLLTLKKNLESLGLNRAALELDSTKGTDGGLAGGEGEGRLRQRDPSSAGAAAAAADASAIPTTAGGDNSTSAALSCAADSTAAAAVAAADGVADRAARVALAVETEGLKETEQSVSMSERVAAATTAEAFGARAELAVRESKGSLGAAVGSTGDNNELRGLHESYLARPEPSLLPLYPPGRAFLLCNSSSDPGTAGRKAGTGGSDDRPVLGERVRTTAAAAAAVAEQIVEATGSASSPLSAISGATTPAGGKIVLVKVPHEHFLRMPLSPSMLEDHAISSYRRALAGVSSEKSRDARV